MKKIIIMSYSLIAALIGAGFASGQEILCFFVRYGKSGFYGIALSSFIFALVIFLIAQLCIKRQISSYTEFLNITASQTFSSVIRFVSGFFSVAVFSAMLASSDNMGVMLFGVPKGAFSLIIAVICMFIFTKKSETVLSANGVIGVIITLGIISCTLYILRYREFHVFSDSVKSIASSYIYSGYNLVSLIPVIVLSANGLKRKSDAAAVSIISGVTMFIMMILMFAAIAVYRGKINLGEIPMLTLAMRQSTGFSFVYAVLLTAAVVTTLLASGEAFIESFSLRGKSARICLFIVFSYALSSFGLSELVNYGYRFSGVVSAIIITYLVIKIIKISRI